MENHFLEEDLYKPVHDFFVNQGYEVRSEVHNCDVLATKDEQLIVIELKKSLSIDLLLQAVKRQKIADIVYLAIPKPKKLTSRHKWTDICNLVKRLELGLILVTIRDKKPLIEIPVHPEPFDYLKSKQASKRKRERLVEELKGRSIDLNKGGSTGKKIITAYKECSLHIACCMEIYGDLSPKKLKLLGTDAKKTASIVTKNFYGWFAKIDRGLYGLTAAGKEFLERYPQLTEHYRKRVLERAADGESNKK